MVVGFPETGFHNLIGRQPKAHAHPVKPRPSAAAIGCRAVTGTGQAGGHRHMGTLGMRKRASDPGDANASIGSWEYECVQIIMFIMLVLVV